MVSQVFDEKDVSRVGHYLSKEAAQNILAIRFANIMFEPLWNANCIDCVQVTIVEDIGTGTRTDYYDGIGVARDVIRNHLLQLLVLTAVEEPVHFTQGALRVGKEKILSAVHLPEDLDASGARGQYTAGWQGGTQAAVFLEREGIPADLTTETFTAVKLFIDSRRWTHVPLYLRAGKRLGKRVTEITVVFKRAAHVPFEDSELTESGQNALITRVQPDEGMTLKFGAKVPGTEIQIRDMTVNFGYGHAFIEDSPEAYKRPILGTLVGSAPLFPHQKEVEPSWQILDPILVHQERTGTFEQYPSDSWDPASTYDMMTRNGRAWRLP